ncbi:hypothetical protein [Effusibacillus consociatus]|uniref:Uncharacterized protein n=1 Tax=Effusibacillus consociatus TaxID=1117041 RepID=A0ABV9PW55_9BACL
MKKWVFALTALSLITALSFQPVPAVSGEKSSSSGNNWSTWTQVKKLSY